MKQKKYILLIILLMIGLTLIITKDKGKLANSSTSEVVDSNIEEESSIVFKSKLTDEKGNTLSSEGLTWDKNKVYKISIKNTEDIVYGERIYLLLNGTQYDLNPDDPEKKYIEVEKNMDDTMTVYFTFPDLPKGKYSGILLIEDQYKNEVEFLTQGSEIRFIIDKESESDSKETAQIDNEKKDLKVKKIDGEHIKKELNRTIDFAVFHESQVEKLVIKQHNTIETVNDRNVRHYAYIYNYIDFGIDYMIGVVIDGNIITSEFDSERHIIMSEEEGVYQIDLPRELIPDSTDYYFILIPFPEYDKKHSVLSFSQKFKLVD